MNFYCFMCNYYVALISALVLLKCSNLTFKNNCSGLKIDLESPPGYSYLWKAYYIITFCCLTQVFVDSAYNYMTMALSQARNLLKRNNLSDDVTDDCVINLMSFYE